MSRLAEASLAVGIAVALSALAFAGCGGGGGGGEGGNGKAGGGGETLNLGQAAVVEYTTTASGDTPAVNTTLGVTVLAVRKGTQAELEQGGLKVEAKDKNTTPYYVDARYANKGDQKLPRTLGVSMEDSDGNSIPTTLIFGIAGKPYKKCKNVNTGTLAPGKSYQACTLFLVPEGQDVGKVLFVSQGADAQIKFTYWEPE